MIRLSPAIGTQSEAVRRNPITALLIIVSCAWVLYIGFILHQSLHASGYLFAIWLSALATDIVVAAPNPGIGFPIKWPVALESWVILACTLLGANALIVYYCIWFGAPPGLMRLVHLIPVFLFGFPIVLALLYFFYFRYTPSELGFNTRYWALPLLVLTIFAVITFVVAPTGLTWHSAPPFDLLVSFFAAAIGEEFVRMLMQTRFAKPLRSTGIAFFAAALIWTYLHIPIVHAQNPGFTWPGTFRSVPLILPIGLLWGYMTHRTKSILPSVIVHGLNVWGLQNFHG